LQRKKGLLVRSENASKAARHETEKQLRVLQTATQEHIELTGRNQDDALQREKELESADDEDEDEDAGAQRTLAIQEIDKQLRLLEAEQTASKIVKQAGNALNTYNTKFSGGNWGIQIGHSTGPINWKGSRA
jgi:hypothetical protein